MAARLADCALSTGVQYADLAAASEFLFIMGYDGQFWDNVQCAAGRSSVNCSQACAPLSSIEYGLQQYLALGIP